MIDSIIYPIRAIKTTTKPYPAKWVGYMDQITP